MNQKVISILVTLYLVACVIFGGSAQGMWSNLALQLLGIALIAFAGIAGGESEEEGKAQWALPALMIASILAVLLQLVPLPPGVWTALPGRAELAQGFAALGYTLPSLPISEAPYNSVATLFSVIPAVAVFVATLRLRPEPRWLALGIVAVTILAVVFGALQVSSGHNSWAYLYKISNPGAVGFFANQNHMATLLLIAIPMAAALLASVKTDRRAAAGRYGTAGVLLLLLVIGIALNGSFAAYALVLPVLLASLSLLPGGAAWRRVALPFAAVALIAGIVILATRPIGTTAMQASASSSVSSRSGVWATTGQAISDSFPVGTGLGSFEQIYRHYEDPANVTHQYVNHAHNEYLELVLELGAPGLVLLLLFLAWWALAAVRIWTSQLSTPFTRAATIVSATILAHSIVDFPLRTAAISAIFAAAIALMAQHLRVSAEPKKGDTRPTRHVKLG
jgi:O-antigen ligase